MGRKKSCDATMRKVIINFYQRGWPYKKIADHLECSKNMVYNAVAYFKTHNTTESVPRKKRPRKTTPQDDRRMIALAKRDPFKGSVHIKSEVFGPELNAGVSARTVRRRLVEAKLVGRVARKVPLLKKEHKQARLAFARKYGNWTVAQWKNVLFSDETKINLISSDGRQYVRRPINSAMNPKYTKKQVKHGGGNIQIWGCLSGHGVGPIKKIEGRLDQFQYKQILEETMIPYAEEVLPVSWTFQHDNDPKHTAQSVKSFLAQQSVTVLDWPANSPDLNPIEHLWYEAKKKVATRRTATKNQLYDQFQAVWNNIPLETCNNLIASMPRRCQMVLTNKGNHTGY